MISTDIAIVGGGCVGLTLALACAVEGISVTLIDGGTGSRQLSQQPEMRVSALSHASEAIFTRLNVWQTIRNTRLCPYQSMHVWEKDSFAQIDFSSEQLNYGQPYAQLGFIVENTVIRNALLEQLAKYPDRVNLVFSRQVTTINLGERQVLLTLDDGTPVVAQLLVGADGPQSFVRESLAMPITFWDYQHHALIATIKTEQPHQFCARQCFLPQGPLAFLPLTGEHLSATEQQQFSSIVWSTSPEQARSLSTCTPQQFEHQLISAFDSRLGMCQLTSERIIVPLTMRYARQWTKPRVALIGDAAHTIHPLAGLGMNLGLLDAASLAEVLIRLKHQRKDLGTHSKLRVYERQGKGRAQTYIAAMEGLKRLFSGNNPLLKLLRGTGLSLANSIHPVKQQIIKQAMGLSGDIPPLAAPVSRD